MAEQTRANRLHWTAWFIALCVVLTAGWMIFDGARALVVGDYVTPRSGVHAGQLGPWSKVASAVGIDPRSTLMMLIFVVYGAVALASLAFFLLQRPAGWWAMLIAAVLGVWYLPFGTLLNVIVIALLFLRPPNAA